MKKLILGIITGIILLSNTIFANSIIGNITQTANIYNSVPCTVAGTDIIIPCRGMVEFELRGNNKIKFKTIMTQNLIGTTNTVMVYLDGQLISYKTAFLDNIPEDYFVEFPKSEGKVWISFTSILPNFAGYSDLTTMIINNPEFY